MSEAVLAIKDVYLRHRGRFLTITKVVIAAGLLSFIVSSVKINRTILVFNDADKFFLTAAVLLSLVNIYMQYWKWRLVCAHLLGISDRMKIIDSLFLGFAAGSFTPARIGEYTGRAVPFNDLPVLRVSSAVLLDKFFSLLIVFSIGLISFLFFIKPDWLFTVIIILMTLAFYYSILRGFFFVSYLRKIGDRWKWSRELLFGFTNLRNSSSEFKLKLMFVSFLFYTCFIVQFALLTAAFSHQYDFLNFIWSGNMVMFTKTIIPPVSFGELGIREGASVYFLKQIGVNAESAFNASIFLFLVNVLLPSLIGLIFLLKRK